MFLVKIEYISTETGKLISLFGKCEFLPVNDYSFAVTIRRRNDTLELEFGKILEQREDFSRITFRTEHGVYELQILEKLKGSQIKPPNVVDFKDFKNKKIERAKGILVRDSEANKDKIKAKVEEIVSLIKCLDPSEKKTVSVLNFINKRKGLRAYKNNSKDLIKNSEESYRK